VGLDEPEADSRELNLRITAARWHGLVPLEHFGACFTSAAGMFVFFRK